LIRHPFNCRGQVSSHAYTISAISDRDSLRHKWTLTPPLNGLSWVGSRRAVSASNPGRSTQIFDLVKPAVR
jgi:hypothetical protein